MRMTLAGRIAALLVAMLVVASTPGRAAGLEVMSVEEAREAAASGAMVLVDIRTPDEWRQSGIPDVAVPLDMRRRDFVQKLLALRDARPSAQLGLICATGGRSRYVAEWLVRNGVTGVVDVPAGMHTRQGWLAKSLPVRAPDAEMPAAVPR